MSKELFISASPHETKVAVLEDDQLVEVYYERDTDVGLVGGIYKGRVSRVLPGMQSAFVDIGLERDAFLYVSDFFEDAEEYEKIVAEAEARVSREAEGSAVSGPIAKVSQGEPSLSEEAPEKPSEAGGVPPVSSDTSEAPEAQLAASQVPSVPAFPTAPPLPTVGAPPSAARRAGESSDYRRHEYRGRRPRRRGRDFGEQKFGPRPQFRDRAPERQVYGPPHTFEILPGESLAKYSQATPEPPSQPTPNSLSGPGAVEPIPAEPAARGVETPPGRFPPVTACEQAPSFPPVPPTEPPATEEIPTVPSLTTPGGPCGDQPEVGPQSLLDRGATEAPVEAPAPPSVTVPPLTVPALGFEAPSTVPGPMPTEPPDISSAPPALPPDSSAAGVLAIAIQKEPAIEEPPQVETGPAAGGKNEGIPVQTPPPDTLSQSTERKYTLREPYQRPRFAPRRGRRGRRGLGQHAPRPEGSPTYKPGPSRPAAPQNPQISELLKEGQEILVQIAKEPLGRKGARITSHIALPGRYLVYMPTVEHIGVSHKIASEEERLRLRNIILENKGSLTGGFIVRTAAEGRSEEEFKADLKFLFTLWSEIRAKAERTKAPALIHRDLDLVQRILRDILSPDFKSVRVDNEIEYERVLEFVSRSQPSLVGQVKLYTRDTPLFEEFGVQTEIEKALKPKVWLKSGGYIVVNQTEALVAIDVNTGKYVGKTNRLEDTIVKTNIDAVNEIVRHIRLRDLGGIIVIDFIDMDERRNRNKVVQALEEALRHDRAPNKIISFNDFGLVALTRKRVKHSLERALCEPCHYCTGSGWIKSVTTVCYEILAEARKMATQIEGNVLTLRVNPEVAHALKSREGGLVSELESITHKDVIIKSDATVHQEQFEIF